MYASTGTGWTSSNRYKGKPLTNIATLTCNSRYGNTSNHSRNVFPKRGSSCDVKLLKRWNIEYLTSKKVSFELIDIILRVCVDSMVQWIFHSLIIYYFKRLVHRKNKTRTTIK